MVTTTTQLARLAGVSQPTVSDVLNGHWRKKGISAGLADRVQKLAKQHHYRPNRLIHALQTGRTHTLAVVLHGIKGDYFPRIAAGIEAEAKLHGYHMLISQVERSSEEVGELEVLLERRVDGLILTPRNIPANIANYRRLIAQDIPLVFVDSYLPGIPCPAVIGEDEEGMRLAARHLIALGHRRIAYIGSIPMDAHMQDRLRGFQKAMADRGLAAPAEHVIGSSRKAVAALLRRPNRPTALLADTDYTAVSVIKVAESMGLRVPVDVAVVGFSDCLENADFLRVPITSVRMDLDKMGRLAMQRFLREVEHVSNRHEVTRAKAQLVVRASCGALKKKIAKGGSK